MPDIPAEAIQAAAIAIERELMSGKDYSMAMDSDEALARAALEAAAPAMAGEIARKITRHMDDRWPSGCVGSQPARRHFRAAAQIAATAFYTEDDMKRMAAGSLPRGEYVACDPEAATRKEGT